MLSDEDMYKRMENGWRGGRPETDCGNGSTLAATENVRRWLPGLAKRFKIRSVCDAGAGDCSWVDRVEWTIRYEAFDLIPRAPGVTKLDITREAMPACDAILCRMVLNHLDRDRNVMAIEQFRKSARYLIATQFDSEKLPKGSREFQRLDLRNAPYNLGNPLESIQDGHEDLCRLAIWKL